MTAHGPLEPLLTSGDIIATLGIARRTLYRMVRGRNIPFLRVGRRFAFRASEIEMWLDERRSESVNRPPTSR
jgi:excisionase family DNA binding protein